MNSILKVKLNSVSKMVSLGLYFSVSKKTTIVTMYKFKISYKTAQSKKYRRWTHALVIVAAFIPMLLIWPGIILSNKYPVTKLDHEL